LVKFNLQNIVSDFAEWIERIGGVHFCNVSASPDVDAIRLKSNKQILLRHKREYNIRFSFLTYEKNVPYISVGIEGFRDIRR